MGAGFPIVVVGMILVVSILGRPEKVRGNPP